MLTLPHLWSTHWLCLLNCWGILYTLGIGSKQLCLVPPSVAVWKDPPVHCYQGQDLSLASSYTMRNLKKHTQGAKLTFMTPNNIIIIPNSIISIQKLRMFVYPFPCQKGSPQTCCLKVHRPITNGLRNDGISKENMLDGTVIWFVALTDVHT